MFDIDKKKDEEELIEFYPVYYEKKVKKRRIIRKMKILAKKAIKLNTFVLDVFLYIYLIVTLKFLSISTLLNTWFYCIFEICIV